MAKGKLRSISRLAGRPLQALLNRAAQCRTDPRKSPAPPVISSNRGHDATFTELPLTYPAHARASGDHQPDHLLREQGVGSSKSPRSDQLIQLLS